MGDGVGTHASGDLSVTPHPPTALPPFPLTPPFLTFIRIPHPTVPLTHISTWRSPCVPWVTLTNAEWKLWACTLGLFSRFLRLVILP